MKLQEFLVVNVVTIICVLIAGALAMMGKDGWGWFLFVALCTGVIFTSKEKEQ